MQTYQTKMYAKLAYHSQIKHIRSTINIETNTQQPGNHMLLNVYLTLRTKSAHVNVLYQLQQYEGLILISLSLSQKDTNTHTCAHAQEYPHVSAHMHTQNTCAHVPADNPDFHFSGKTLRASMPKKNTKQNGNGKKTKRTQTTG